LIEQSGSPHEIYNRPANEFVARFMGGHNIFDVKVDVESGQVGKKVGVRNDQIQLKPATEANSDSAFNKRAVVTDVEYQGTYVLLGLSQKASVQTTADWSVMLSEPEFNKRPFAVGEAVQMLWTPEAAHALQI
jgi:putative spermidine/putrescine transport system ATP-binding protein